MDNVTPTVLSLDFDKSNIAEGERVEITGKIFHETFDDSGLNVELNLGNGELRYPSLGDWEVGPEGSYRSFSQPYTYEDNGSRTVSARIYDEEGGFGSMAKSIVVTNSPPALQSPDYVYLEPGETFYYPDTFEDPGSDSWTGLVRWTATGSFEDLPLFGRGFDLDHTFTEVGIHTVTVEITDDDGGKGTREQTIVVGSPALGVREIDPQLYELYWSGEFRLQGATSLPSDDWVNIEVSGEPTEEGEHSVRIISEGEGEEGGEGVLRFFRLIWP